MSFKLERANAQIQKSLAEIIAEMNDPRLSGKMVSVVRVAVSPDLKHASVIVSVFDKDKTAAFSAINKASSFIRHELARRLDFRIIPNLNFELDDTEDRLKNLDEKFKMIERL